MNNFTKRLLVNAKISKGMKVLDLGCEKGEVSFLAADIVGASGQIFGIDNQEKAIAKERIIGEGVATETDLDVATLESRLSQELQENTIYISDMAVGVCGYTSIVP